MSFHICMCGNYAANIRIYIYYIIIIYIIYEWACLFHTEIHIFLNSYSSKADFYIISQYYTFFTVMSHHWIFDKMCDFNNSSIIDTLLLLWILIEGMWKGLYTIRAVFAHQNKQLCFDFKMI